MLNSVVRTFTGEKQLNDMQHFEASVFNTVVY